MEYLIKTIVKKLIERRGNFGYYYNLSEGKLEKYEMENWKYPSNNFIKANPNPDKAFLKKDNCIENGKFFICKAERKKTKEIIELKLPKNLMTELVKRYRKKNRVEIFLEPPKRSLDIKYSKYKGICSICGNEDYVVKGKQWMYPFLVDPQKFSNFYSMTKGENLFCLRCALGGLAGYLSWLYYIRRDEFMHIFLFHSDLETLYEIREKIIKPLSLAGSNATNFKLSFYGKYIHETTMGLLLEIFRTLREEEKVDAEIAKFLNEVFYSREIKLYAISGKPGKGFNINSLFEFSKFVSLYKLYNKWIDILIKKYPLEGINHLDNIFKQFYVRQQKNKVESIWRDKICWAILDFKDPFPFIELYLYDGVASQKPGERYGLKKGTMIVFEEYAKVVLNMEEKSMRILAGFGHEVGKVSAQKDDMGILYSLRNAKNIDDFLKVLNDINFKLGLTVNEELLNIEKDKIMGVPWIRVKTLLSIYAMNSYLWEKKKGGGKSGE